MSSWLAEFHFLRPLWLLALALLPLLLLAWRRERDAADPWRAACDPHLLPHLRGDASVAPSRVPRRLFVIGYALAVLAIAGPAYRQAPQALARADSALLIALDLSERMRTPDLKPDRLSRAKFKVADLIRDRREGQTALLAYAGDAFVVAPLTDDAKSLADLLAALMPETMPVGGQRPQRAIALARRLLRDAGFARGDLLLVTDDVDAEAIDAARAAAADGLRVSVLGVGTTAGAPLPLARGGFAQDADGNVLLPKLDEVALRELASAGGGRYAMLANDAGDLRALGLLDAQPGSSEFRDDDRQRVAYRDEGPWLLLALLPLAAFGFRRGWLGVVLFAALMQPPPAHAFDWQRLWRNPDQRAQSALAAGDAQRALELARDPALRGSAAYRSGDFARAAADFARVDSAAAHYNRGNALAKAERYEEALAAYDAALARDPAFEDAVANRQAVEEWLRQQEQQKQPQEQDPQPPESQQQPSGEEGEQGESQPGEPQQGEPSQNEQGDAQPRDGEPGADEAQESGTAGEQQREQAEKEFAEQMQRALEEAGDEQQPGDATAVDPRAAEKQQAVEQWLRRVPDDPGGLLRRKFALEYQRRRREGDGE